MGEATVRGRLLVDGQQGDGQAPQPPSGIILVVPGKTERTALWLRSRTEQPRLDLGLRGCLFSLPGEQVLPEPGVLLGVLPD